MIAVREPNKTDIDHLCRAIKTFPGETLANVLENINNGTCVLLRSQNSTLTIALEPCGLHINQMGGTLDDVGEIKECLIKLAKQYGKKYITLEGRKGWQRALKPWGMYPRGNRMVFEV